ncbi:unnamed protein product [Amoebophrya sp. A120]|nr:unnamed protein product [Amoebophrya sp. A120]|eukprot:GSA120T00014227001.1
MPSSMRNLLSSTGIGQPGTGVTARSSVGAATAAHQLQQDGLVAGAKNKPGAAAGRQTSTPTADHAESKPQISALQPLIDYAVKQHFEHEYPDFYVLESEENKNENHGKSTSQGSSFSAGAIGTSGTSSTNLVVLGGSSSSASADELFEDHNHDKSDAERQGRTASQKASTSSPKALQEEILKRSAELFLHFCTPTVPALKHEPQGGAASSGPSGAGSPGRRKKTVANTTSSSHLHQNSERSKELQFKKTLASSTISIADVGILVRGLNLFCDEVEQFCGFHLHEHAGPPGQLHLPGGGPAAGEEFFYHQEQMSRTAQMHQHYVKILEEDGIKRLLQLPEVIFGNSELNLLRRKKISTVISEEGQLTCVSTSNEQMSSSDELGTSAAGGDVALLQDHSALGLNKQVSRSSGTSSTSNLASFGASAAVVVSEMISSSRPFGTPGDGAAQEGEEGHVALGESTSLKAVTTADGDVDSAHIEVPVSGSSPGDAGNAPLPPLPGAVTTSSAANPENDNGTNQPTANEPLEEVTLPQFLRLISQLTGFATFAHQLQLAAANETSGGDDVLNKAVSSGDSASRATAVIRAATMSRICTRSTATSGTSSSKHSFQDFFQNLVTPSTGTTRGAGSSSQLFGDSFYAGPIDVRASTINNPLFGGNGAGVVAHETSGHAGGTTTTHRITAAGTANAAGNINSSPSAAGAMARFSNAIASPFSTAAGTTGAQHAAERTTSTSVLLPGRQTTASDTTPGGGAGRFSTLLEDTTESMNHNDPSGRATNRTTLQLNLFNRDNSSKTLTNNVSTMIQSHPLDHLLKPVLLSLYDEGIFPNDDFVRRAQVAVSKKEIPQTNEWLQRALEMSLALEERQSVAELQVIDCLNDLERFLELFCKFERKRETEKREIEHEEALRLPEIKDFLQQEIEELSMKLREENLLQIRVFEDWEEEHNLLQQDKEKMLQKLSKVQKFYQKKCKKLSKLMTKMLQRDLELEKLSEVIPKYAQLQDEIFKIEEENEGMENLLKEIVSTGEKQVKEQLKVLDNLQPSQKIFSEKHLKESVCLYQKACQNASKRVETEFPYWKIISRPSSNRRNYEYYKAPGEPSPTLPKVEKERENRRWSIDIGYEKFFGNNSAGGGSNGGMSSPGGGGGGGRGGGIIQLASAANSAGGVVVGGNKNAANKVGNAPVVLKNQTRIRSRSDLNL